MVKQFIVGTLALALGAVACSSARDRESVAESSGSLAAFTGVLTQHNDLGRTGANLNETILKVANVNTTSFGKLTSLAVSGQIYAQPLYVAAAIGGKNAVFIATEQNKVYAFHADPPWEALWSGGVRTLETAWSPQSFNCSNTQSPFGINSTPVIDPGANPPSTATLYVVTKTSVSSVPKYFLHALDLSTGQDRAGSPIDMGLDASGAAVSVTGTGAGSVNNKLTFDPSTHQNRVALTLSQGVLSVGFGSYCDHDPYHGWILRFNTTTTPITPLPAFVTTPNTSRGALWMGGSGFAVDENGALYFTSGNGPLSGTVTTGSSLGNAFVQLSGSTTQAPSATSWFMPSDVADQDLHDTDVGSSGPLLIPGTDRIVGGGKNGVFYVLHRGAMGGFQASTTPPDPQIVQRFSTVNAPQWIIGSPVYWSGPQGPTIYVWPGKTPLAQYLFNTTSGTFTTPPLHQSGDNPQVDLQGGQLSLSANGTGAASAGTGIVWATHPLQSTGGGAAVPGVLYAFNAEDVSSKLWDSSQRPQDALASASKYTAPTVADGKVFVPTFSNEVDVYGLTAGSGGGGGTGGAGGTSGAGGSGGSGGASGGAAAFVDCNTVVDPGPAQPTTWSYVYSTYFAAGTTGHCSNCHTPSPGPGNFTSGTTQDTCYAGLVSVGQITPNNGAASPIGDPARSALTWFGSRATGPGIIEFMPRDMQGQNLRAAAAVCGWVKAGAPGVSCSLPQTACGAACFDLSSDAAHCGSCATACASGSVCCGGSCTDLSTNPNCGTCGTTCASGKVCSNKQCLASIGQACSASGDCSSGFCVDNVCCSSSCGTCMACSAAKTGQASGTCAPTLNGQGDTRCTPAPPCGNDGTCNGTGACRMTVAGTSCGAASCTAGVAQPAPTCSGSGTCVTPSTKACSPFICGTNACTTSCTTNANCAAGAQCTGGLCVACAGGVCCAAGQANCGGTCVNTATDPANCGACGRACAAGATCSGGTCLGGVGQTCTTPSQCASGACVDGFCCNSACTGTCTACSAARTGTANGTCAAITVGGADSRCVPAPPCGKTGLCAAGSVCQVAPATTSCRSPSCASGVQTAAATCNGSGACPTAVTSNCNPFICGPTACKTSCAADTDCIAGDYCAGTSCAPKKATGASCATDHECTTSSCSTDGVCCSGTCKLACQACSLAKTGLATGTCGPTTTPTGTNVCNNACVNTLTDPANCGGCGKACATGASCTNGTCSALACTTTNALIDNFEDANNQVSLLEGRNGALYTYVDTTGSTISPAAASTFTPATGGNASSARAAHFSGHLSSASTVWAGFGADFMSPKALYNASKYTSLSFYAKKGSSTASSAVRVKIPDRNTDPVGGVCTACANDFGTDITLTTTWTKYTIPLSSMTQLAGWGAPRPAHLDPSGVVAVQFQVTAPGANYDIWVDDLSFGCN